MKGYPRVVVRVAWANTYDERWCFYVNPAPRGVEVRGTFEYRSAASAEAAGKRFLKSLGVKT